MIGIYHSRDLDGFACGAIIKKKYPEATLIGFDYGDSFEELLNKIGHDDDVIMADVSLPMDQMAQLADHVFGKFTWIDHHASAIKDYTEYMLKNFKGSPTGFLTPVLEDGISACEGTWKYLYSSGNMPRAVELLGQYDTWRNKDRELWDKWIMPFQYGMRLNVNSPDTFPLYLLNDRVSTDDIVEICRTGETILRYQKQQNEYSMKKAFVIDFHGYRCVACNSGSGSTSFDSVYDEQKHDLMMTFKYTGTQWVFGIYTTKDIDLSELAKLHGGGGHRSAAGFQLDNIPTILFNMGNVSDGYHTFNELYDHRITLYIQLCKEIDNRTGPAPVVWKTTVHSDGSIWDGWFILGIHKEAGKQITYHLPMDRYNECSFAHTLDKAPTWDGHTSADVLERIKTL